MPTTVQALPSVTVGALQSLHCLGSAPQYAGPPQPPASTPAAPSWPDDADVSHAVISGRGLRIVYQPQYNLHSRRIISAEALLRWHHPHYGNVPPSVFIPMVNRLGLHWRLFQLVVAQVVDVLRCLRSIGADVPIAVNASVDTVCEPGMADFLARTMWNACLPARLLKVEMTEELPVLDELSLSASLNALRGKGFPLSLDDFGAGFATLEVLVKMPFDEVKIDGAFIRGMQTNAQSQAIVATVISLAQRLNVKLVAEGIEDETMATSLRDMGCRIGQGYALSRPMERADFLQHQLENNTASDLKAQ